MRILVGISGGFDSAYSAHLLREAGHTVEGAVLQMHAYTELDEAQKAAAALGIPLHVVDCRALFEKEVVTPFCEEYLAARTPNPCIVCNERVKFKALYDYALSHGFDRIATGHYAQIVRTDGRIAVAMARDASKDQSYMLYRVPGEILEKLVLPMGLLIKKEAKEQGARISLAAADREESQEICFVQGEGYADFIERRYGSSPHGDFVSESGEVLGRHRGIIRYTVGQRKGLGVSASGRLFIQRIDPESNRILLSEHMPTCRRFAVGSAVFSYLTLAEVLAHSSLTVRVRYTARPVPVDVVKVDGELICTLHEESRTAVTLGQSAVFYVGDTVAFGGVITKVL